MTDGPSLKRVFKAYDVRGLVPDDLSPDLVRKIGAASPGTQDAERHEGDA